MSNELDLLMSLDPLELSAQIIDEIIAYHRKARANYEAGIKPKKEKGPKVEIDLVALGLAPAPEPFKRRF